jgi:leucyl aminopeptidase
MANKYEIPFDIIGYDKEMKEKIKKEKKDIAVIRLCVDKEREIGETYLFNDGKEKRLDVFISKSSDSIDVEQVRRASINAHSLCKNFKLNEIILDIDIKEQSIKKEVNDAFIEGLILSSFSFSENNDKDKDISKNAEKGEKSFKIKKIYVPFFDLSTERTVIFASCQNYARKLANLPPNIGTPEFFAREAKELANKYRMKITIWDKKTLEKKGLNLALSVNAGSDRGVYLVHIKYRNKNAKRSFAVVGKGICFDSGGLGIKPAKSMVNMHLDKSGACAVLGIVKACAMCNMNVNIDAVAIFTENVISGKAVKPSSIVNSYSGKKVEILHTDAEGRLILADAMAYVVKHIKPDYIIDLATLTGAMLTTLGDKAIGLFTNNYDLERALIKAGYKTYERVWPMPMFKEYEEMMKSDVADIKNLGSWEGYASSITGAKFIEAFVNGYPWAHLDIASMMEVPWIPYLGKRGSGCGVRLVLRAIENLIED